MTNELVNQKVIEREEILAQIKVLQAEADKITADLKSEIDSRKVDCLETDTFNLFYLLQSKHTFNSRKFKAENPELHEKYCEDKVNTFFTITRK